LGRKKYKIGLALGGGGARTLACIGLISILEKENISIDYIAGTSAGALVGAFYALYPDSSKLKITAQKIVEKINKNPIQIDFDFGGGAKDKKYLLWRRLTDLIKKGYFLHTELRRTYLNNGEIIKDIVTEVFGNHSFNETKIPFSVVAADLITGKEVMLKEGLLSEAILASCSIPGVFPPVKYNEYLLVDGGIVNAVPIEVVRKMGADFVIASNLTRELKKKNNFQNAIDILLRSDMITSRKLRELQLEMADFTITPEISHIDWWNFNKPEQCIFCGGKAAEKEIAGLKMAIRNKRVRTKLSRFYSRIR